MISPSKASSRKAKKAKSLGNSIEQQPPSSSAGSLQKARTSTSSAKSGLDPSIASSATEKLKSPKRRRDDEHVAVRQSPSASELTPEELKKRRKEEKKEKKKKKKEKKRLERERLRSSSASQGNIPVARPEIPEQPKKKKRKTEAKERTNAEQHLSATSLPNLSPIAGQPAKASAPLQLASTEPKKRKKKDEKLGLEGTVSGTKAPQQTPRRERESAAEVAPPKSSQPIDAEPKKRKTTQPKETVSNAEVAKRSGAVQSSRGNNNADKASRTGIPAEPATPYTTHSRRAGKEKEVIAPTQAEPAVQAGPSVAARRPSREKSMLSAAAQKPAAAKSSQKSASQTQARISAALEEDRPSGSRRLSRRSDLDSVGGALNTKEGLLASVAGMSHAEILSDLLLSSKQIQILRQNLGLNVKHGAFSKWEDEHLADELEKFKADNRMNDEALRDFIFQPRQTAEAAALYVDMWKRLARRLSDRTQTSVRLHVRRDLQDRASAGKWTDEEVSLLSDAVHIYGTNWESVAKHVGRRGEDCRVRWRDIGDRESRVLGSWSDEEETALFRAVDRVCQDKGIRNPLANVLKIPWSKVASVLNDTRTATQCRIKWTGAIDKQPRWTHTDTAEFVERLSRQRRALDHDDYYEMDWPSLTDGWKPWGQKTLSKKWGRLMERHVAHVKGDELYTNFKANLSKIKKGERADRIAREAAHAAEKARKPRRTDDLIESEEERDLVGRGGEEDMYEA